MKLRLVRFSFFFYFFSLLIPLSYALDYTAKDAVDVYKKRGVSSEGIQNAKKAAMMFEQLAKMATDENKEDNVIAQLLIWQSKSLYYYADQVQDNEIKKEGHYQGSQMALKAAALLHLPGQPVQPKQPQYKRSLALAYYWQGANLGKWGLARGVLNSLREWPTLKRQVEHIFTLGEKDLEDYGANRILGRAYYTLPFPLGDKNKALKLLEEANDKSLASSGDISRNGLNVIYYADALIVKGRKDKAKSLLLNLVSKGQSPSALTSYNDDRIPETLEEIAEAKTILQRL